MHSNVKAQPQTDGGTPWLSDCSEKLGIGSHFAHFIK
jgi:hypothetical protein